ncbi:MAG: cupin domain-containing protein [Steroidobacteraceae bacterium]
MSRIDSKTWTIAEAGAALAKSGANFVTLFRQGTLEIEIYRPVGSDPQKPHRKDELYVVINGTGTFVHGETRTRFHEGDALFVRAGVPHRFEDFSPDFATWVFFYGPEGGE